MSSNTTSAGTKLRGPDGIIAIYRPMFEGEGRAIWGQAIVSFFGGMCEALLLVVLAKLAFGIGGGGGDLEAGLGPLKDLHLDIKSLFAIGIGVQRDLPGRRCLPVLPVQSRLKDRAHPVIVGLGNRVVPMVVTLGTVQRQSEQRRADNLQRVGHHLIPRDPLVLSA